VVALDRPGEEDIFSVPGQTAEVDQIARKLSEHRLLIRVDVALLTVDEIDPAGCDSIDPPFG
jgi:hypothetical protein